MTKTALNQLTSVQSSFSRFVSLWGLVQVSVLSKFDKRPDWTRLPSTGYTQPWAALRSACCLSYFVGGIWWGQQWVLGPAQMLENRAIEKMSEKLGGKYQRLTNSGVLVNAHRIPVMRHMGCQPSLTMACNKVCADTMRADYSDPLRK